MLSIIYLCIVNSAYAASKWRTIFKCYLFIGIIWVAAVACATVIVPLTGIYASL